MSRQSPTLSRPSPTTRSTSGARRDETGLYLGGFARSPLLSREGEIELARLVEQGEQTILRALAGSDVALAELGVIGEDLAAGRLRPHDVLRAAEPDQHADAEDETAARLTGLLRRAGELARAPRGGARAERRALLDELERIRLHRRALDRVTGAVRASPATSDDAARSTLQAIEAGRRIADAAKARLVESNLRLVVAFAKRHAQSGMGLHDLIQEGNIGLMRAVDKFDHRRGRRFSTYASWWVRQQMTRAVAEQGKTIRVPMHLVDTRRKVLRARRELEQEHGRAPADEEVAARTALTLEKVRAIDRIVAEPLSLAAPTGADHHAEIGDFTPDRSTPPVDEQIADAGLREEARELVAMLSPREQGILKRRFGLDGGREHSLAEIGASLSLSRERIRQIEAEALRRLRGRLEERQAR